MLMLRSLAHIKGGFSRMTPRKDEDAWFFSVVVNTSDCLSEDHWFESDKNRQLQNDNLALITNEMTL